MPKAEYLTSKEVASLLSISTSHLYDWGSDDPNKRRPFFPKSEMIRRTNGGDRRLIHQYNKAAVMRFIKEAEEKPYYRFSQAKYEKMKAETRQKEALPASAFNDFHKLMFQLKQRRMEADNG